MDPTTVYRLQRDQLAETRRRARRDALGRSGRAARRPQLPAGTAAGPLAALTRMTNHRRGVSA